MGITHWVGKIKLKLLFHGPLNDWVNKHWNRFDWRFFKPSSCLIKVFLINVQNLRFSDGSERYDFSNSIGSMVDDWYIYLHENHKLFFLKGNLCITHTIHGTNGIFCLHEWLIFMVFHVGKIYPSSPWESVMGEAMRAPKTGSAFTETASPQAVNTLKDARNEVCRRFLAVRDVMFPTWNLKDHETHTWAMKRTLVVSGI